MTLRTGTLPSGGGGRRASWRRREKQGAGMCLSQEAWLSGDIYRHFGEEREEKLTGRESGRHRKHPVVKTPEEGQR